MALPPWAWMLLISAISFAIFYFSGGRSGGGGLAGAIVMFLVSLGAYYFTGAIDPIFFIIVFVGGLLVGIVYSITTGRAGTVRPGGWYHFGAIALAAVLAWMWWTIGRTSPLIALLFALGLCFVTAISLPGRMRADILSVHGLLLGFTLVLHFWLWANDFSIYLLAIQAGVSFLIGLAYYFLFSQAAAGGSTEQQHREVITAFVLGIVVYLIPYVLQQHLLPYLTGLLPYMNNIATTLLDFTVLLVVLLPVWPLFILHRMRTRNPAGYGAAFLHVYRFLLIVIIAGGFVINLLFQLPDLAQTVIPGGISATVDGQTSFSGATQRIKDAWAGVWGRGTGLYNRALNPGEYYTGQVEDNKGKPLGVTVSDLRVVDNTIDDRTPVIVYGNVQALSFLGDRVRVTPTCTMDRPGSPAATVDPPVMEVVYGTSGTFQCTFPPLGRQGLYSIKAGVTFPFETWSYITYEFVDEERALDLAQQGLSVRTTLDIDEMPEATYTNGPVVLGMGGTPQPILVRPDHKTDILPPGSRIGLTLDRDWSGGRIDRVEQFQLKVPAPFELESCDRTWTSKAPDPNDPEYTSYEFDNPSTSPMLSYTSLTCRLVIPTTAKDDARKLVSTEKTPRSFVAVAKYTYTVEDVVAVRVG